MHSLNEAVRMAAALRCSFHIRPVSLLSLSVDSRAPDSFPRRMTSGVHFRVLQLSLYPLLRWAMRPAAVRCRWMRTFQRRSWKTNHLRGWRSAFLTRITSFDLDDSCTEWHMSVCRSLWISQPETQLPVVVLQQHKDKLKISGCRRKGAIRSQLRSSLVLAGPHELIPEASSNPIYVIKVYFSGRAMVLRGTLKPYLTEMHAPLQKGWFSLMHLSQLAFVAKISMLQVPVGPANVGTWLKLTIQSWFSQCI